MQGLTAEQDAASRQLQGLVTRRVREPEVSLDEVRWLRQLLPICSYCRKIRKDQNDWEQVDRSLTARCDAWFSHGICPNCLEAARREFESPPVAEGQ